ncbi:MAG: DUF4166 domain-containing protein, partial [Porticoccaceae bacterium]|nr:DUF4166 domain-containing protein [Porticoccaceae bacterium]
HYRNHPYSDDETVVHGSLDILCKAPLIWLAPVMRFLGQIPAINAKQMPVTVRFKSHKNNRQFQFDRQFNLKNRKPYFFKSRMVQVKGSEVIEIMKFRLGWKMNYSWDGEKVSLSHKGYVLCLFGCFIPLPITWLMGSGNAQEWPVDENRFAMSVQITHPWWGKVYEYKGQFEVAA